jgi:hypothetical protein
MSEKMGGRHLEMFLKVQITDFVAIGMYVVYQFAMKS